MTDDLLKHIAHLFYAIAKADKTLSFEEYVKLSEELENNWQSIGDENIQLIRNQFHILQKEHKSASLSYDKFANYLHEHPSQFSDELKNLILKTANNIAYAFSKINKSELYYLAKLSLEFKKN